METRRRAGGPGTASGCAQRSRSATTPSSTPPSSRSRPDLTLVDTILQRHGSTPFDDRFIGASLDHSIWFHRPFRADEWLFYDQTSPIAFGARGLARGLLYSRSGDLVASAVQEGLVRLPADA